MIQKPFSFNQGVFFEVGTRFSSENEGNQNSLLWPEKTFSFNQGVFFEVGTRFSSENEGNQNSYDFASITSGRSFPLFPAPLISE